MVDRVIVLLVDSWFDTPLWSTVESNLSSSLGSAILVRPYSSRPLPTTGPMVNGLDVVERISARAPDANVRLGIGHQTGAGPVAALVNEGLLDAGVLIDPIMAPMVRTDPSLSRFVAREDPELLDRMAAHLSQIDDLPAGESWGEAAPESVLEASTGAFTGDPIRMRVAELERHEFQRRAPLIRHVLVPDEAAERLNWLTAWSKPENDLEVWVSTPLNDLGDHLARQPAPHGPSLLTDWPRFPVLSAPDAVTERMAAWISQKIAKHENPD